MGLLGVDFLGHITCCNRSIVTTLLLIVCQILLYNHKTTSIQMDSTHSEDVPISVSQVNNGIVEKAKEDWISNADTIETRLSTPHREFLLRRHGTLDLDPIPSMDPADPYNWPAWKVISS